FTGHRAVDAARSDHDRSRQLHRPAAAVPVLDVAGHESDAALDAGGDTLQPAELGRHRRPRSRPSWHGLGLDWRAHAVSRRPPSRLHARVPPLAFSRFPAAPLAGPFPVGPPLADEDPLPLLPGLTAGAREPGDAPPPVCADLFPHLHPLDYAEPLARRDLIAL